MTMQEFNTKVWSFYLRLENNFIDTLSYVEFAEDNFETYSIEFEKQLLAIGSEVDVLCKLLCNAIDPNRNVSRINEYANILTGYDNFTSAKVCFSKNGQEYVPFDGWTQRESPSWWKAYNKVKHDRINEDNYKKGNLKNTFLALTGLYVLNRYYCKIVSSEQAVKEPMPKSQLFTMVGWDEYIPFGNKYTWVAGADGHLTL